MSDLEQSILNTLLELDAAVRSIRTGNRKPDLQPLFSRLDYLASQLPKGTDPQLRHYLNNKSYEKARLLLQSPPFAAHHS